MDKYGALSRHVDRSMNTEDIGIKDYFSSKNEWVKKFISPSSIQKDWDLIVDEEKDFQIFSWPLFTEEFCKQVILEAELKDNWNSSRHEYYPTTDKLLSWIGLDKTYNEILKEFVYPAAKHLYSLEGKTWNNLNFENFIIKYENNEEKQRSLKIHHDFSLITALVTLNQHGKDFTGGGTLFQRQKRLVHKPVGYVTIHPGNITHKHGARPVTSGKRYVIVTFSSNK